MSFHIDLDTREFDKALKDYAAVSKKDAQDIVQDRARKMLTGTKGVPGMYQEFKKFAPTVSHLRALPKKLDYHVRRKEGMTAAAEIRRRIRSRFSAAAGWLPALWRLSKSAGQRVLKTIKHPRGSVEINLSEPSVTIINSMKEAVEADKKYNLVQKVVNAHEADMRTYIDRKMTERAKQFSAK